ncbi:hypothetical protein D9M70_467730 [compost metagenome]
MALQRPHLASYPVRDTPAEPKLGETSCGCWGMLLLTTMAGKYRVMLPRPRQIPLTGRVRMTDKRRLKARTSGMAPCRQLFRRWMISASAADNDTAGINGGTRIQRQARSRGRPNQERPAQQGQKGQQGESDERRSPYRTCTAPCGNHHEDPPWRASEDGPPWLCPSRHLCRQRRGGALCLVQRLPALRPGRKDHPRRLCRRLRLPRRAGHASQVHRGGDRTARDCAAWRGRLPPSYQ